MRRELERDLTRCVATLAHALRERDAWIAAMRAEGHSLRVIAAAAQLTPEGVRGVLARQPAQARGRNVEQSLRRWATKARAATEKRARLLLALRDHLSERELADLSGLSRTAVRHQVHQASTGALPKVVRART